MLLMFVGFFFFIQDVNDVIEALHFMQKSFRVDSHMDAGHLIKNCSEFESLLFRSRCVISNVSSFKAALAPGSCLLE